jgi:beta-phosphoglucomutase
MRTILWDMDGTIADSERVHFRAWEMSLEKYDIAYSYADFKAGFGRSNASLIPELMDVEPDSEIVWQVSREKEACFRRLAREEGLDSLPGVIDWLNRFRDEDVQQVVSSSGPMANIAASVDILDIGDYFLSLMSGATLPRSKPDPALFLNSAAAVGAPPHACIVVEDSAHGIEAAVRAGMAAIAVGKVAQSDEVAHLREDAPSFACLCVDRMDEVTWEACEALWRQTGSQ